MPGEGFELASTCSSNVQHEHCTNRFITKPSTTCCNLATQGPSEGAMAVRCTPTDFQCDAIRQDARGEYRQWLANECSPCFGHITITSAADSMPPVCASVLFYAFPQLSQT